MFADRHFPLDILDLIHQTKEGLVATDRILTAQFPTSTSIRSASYNATTLVLTIIYKNKTISGKDTYSYSSVPKRDWDALTSAASVGAYVQKHIIGKYAEVVTEYDATAGRAALQLLTELDDTIRLTNPTSPYIMTPPAYDRDWLKRVRKLLNR